MYGLPHELMTGDNLLEDKGWGEGWDHKLQKEGSPACRGLVFKMCPSRVYGAHETGQHQGYFSYINLKNDIEYQSWIVSHSS